MKPLRSFASDNNAGIHPDVLKAISAVNQGHVVGYGDDAYTQSAVKKFREHFGDDISVYFVFNGTAANVLSLKALTESYHAVICPEAAHIYTDECGAPEKFTGCKLIPIATRDGKLTVESVAHAYHGIGDHLSFGGTKNGLMGGEAVVFFKKNPAEKKVGQDFLYLRKQGMQLASKMRFIAAQMEALLTNDLWLTNAQHSNRMAKLLEKEVSQIAQVKIVYKVEANGVFAQIPKHAIRKLQERYFFYVWNEEQSVVRWMCSFDTIEQDVKDFVKFLRETVGG